MFVSEGISLSISFLILSLYTHKHSQTHTNQVQTLKHEPHHVSSLCYFLFLRAIQNPRLIGHILFWYLEVRKCDFCLRSGMIDFFGKQSELDSIDMSHRFRLLKKELLLSFNEEFRNELLRQVRSLSLSLSLSLSHTHTHTLSHTFFCSRSLSLSLFLSFHESAFTQFHSFSPFFSNLLFISSHTHPLCAVCCSPSAAYYRETSEGAEGERKERRSSAKRTTESE